MKYGIENHPSISSEYFNFLVTNYPSRDQGSATEVKLDAMVDTIGESENIAKGENTVAGSAYNTISHLKRMLEKMEKKRGREVTQSLKDEDNETIKCYPKVKVLTSSVNYRGSLFPLKSKLDVLVLAEWWTSWVYSAKGLVWRNIVVSCQCERGLKRAWFINKEEREWKSWDILESTVKLHRDRTGTQVVCLQGSCDFIIEAIKVMTSWVKTSLNRIIVFPSEGRGGDPLKKIEEQRIR